MSNQPKSISSEVSPEYGDAYSMAPRVQLVDVKMVDHAFVEAVPMRSSRQVVAFVRDRIALCTKEHFICMFLNARHQVTGYQIVSVGTAVAALVHPREVFQLAILQNASAIVIAHNHPSGDPAVSPEDLAITRRLCEVADVIGIEVIDHVIVGGDRYTSFLDQRLPPFTDRA